MEKAKAETVQRRTVLRDKSPNDRYNSGCWSRTPFAYEEWKIPKTSTAAVMKMLLRVKAADSWMRGVRDRVYHVYKRDDRPMTMPLNSRRCTTDSSLLRVRGHCSNKNGAKQLNFSIC